jgi:type I restriction enzyme M protein
LKPYDLISPERASKNIGDFCVLMPGQDRIVLTKEVLVVRASTTAPFDQFYLMWALTLREVRAQWKRVILMQTNREDVGNRAFEIQIPVPKNRKTADEVSKHFRDYYQRLEAARQTFATSLRESPYKHHVFLETAKPLDEEEEGSESEEMTS